MGLGDGAQLPGGDAGGGGIVHCEGIVGRKSASVRAKRRAKYRFAGPRSLDNKQW